MFPFSCVPELLRYALAQMPKSMRQEATVLLSEAIKSR